MSVHPSDAVLHDLEASAESAARLLKVMASEQRLLILCRLMQGEASVGELSESARLAQTGASQHLARMRSEGLVSTRREGQTIWYRLEDRNVARIMLALCELYGMRPVEAENEPA
jgi:DNA-binding transcriptional ArsR family regulator